MAIINAKVCINGIVTEQEVYIPDEELIREETDEISDYEALAIITGGTSV